MAEAQPVTSGMPGGEALPMAPATTWHSHVLDTITLNSELNRLWAQVGAAAAQPEAGHATPTPTTADGVPMRANTLNLIAVARSAGEATAIEDAVAALRDFFPSRVIIVLADLERQDLADGGLEVTVELRQVASRNGPAVRFESVKVETGADAPSHLASVVSPLLVPELPDFLWWPGESVPGRTLFDEVDEVIDRLIVDTAGVVDPASDLQTLATLITRVRNCPKLSDFAWSRLLPWRQLIAQFFDVPAVQPCLSCLNEVTIVYGATGARGGSGLTAGLLMAGWLATRLAWSAPGELIREEDGWRLTLSAGPRGHRREVVLRLQATDDPLAAACLGAVTLNARGERSGRFAVTRASKDGLLTTSETSTMPRVSRMVYAVPPGIADLLDGELQAFNRDPVFEQALTFAAELLPGGSAAS